MSSSLAGRDKRVEAKDVPGQPEPDELRGKQRRTELGSVGPDPLDHGQREIDRDELAEGRGRGRVGEGGIDQGHDRVAVLVAVPVADKPTCGVVAHLRCGDLLDLGGDLARVEGQLDNGCEQPGLRPEELNDQ